MKRIVKLCLLTVLVTAQVLDAATASVTPPAPILSMPGSSKPLVPVTLPVTSTKTIATIIGQATSTPVQMQVLVLAGDSSEYSYQSITAYLTQLGVPYQGIAVDTLTPDANGNRLDSLTLTNTLGQGVYQGIIETNSTFGVCNPTCINLLSTSDWSKLDSYATQYGVRVVTYYTYPDARWGLKLQGQGAGYNASSPLDVTLTTAGQAIFPYINAANAVPVAGSGTGSIWAYKAQATAAAGETTTPILMAGSSVVGVTHTSSAGEQTLSLTFDNYPTLLHSLAFSYGVINWVTRGVFLGARQIYLNIQDDDILFGDRLYAPTLSQCPAAPSCPDVQTTPTDLQALLNWQTAKQQDPQLPYVRTSFAYVGIGSTYGPNNVQEAQTMTQMAGDYGWLTHTWTHGNPDCFTLSPSGTCVLATLAEGLSDLELNTVYGTSIGLPTDSTGFVTPFNTGLDNQDYLTAAAWEGITSVINAAAPPSTNTGSFSTLVPSLYLVPRLVTNLNDDEDSPDTGVYGSLPDEYNAMYGPNGTNPYFTTNQTYSQIISNESTNVLLLDLLTYAPFPLGFHTSNSVAYDGVHSIMSDLFDATFTAYESIYNLPIYTLQTMRDIAPLLLARQTYNASGVTGVYTPGVSVVLTTVNAATIPVTGACSQAVCPSYGGQMQDYVSMTAGSSVTLSLTAGTGPGLSSILLTPQTVNSTSPATGVVSLNGVAQSAMTVALTSSSGLAVVPPSVTIRPGDRGASFTITTGAVTTPTIITISATYNGVTQSVPLTITPAIYLSGVSLSASSVNGGGTSTGTVTLSAAAPASGIVVYLLSNNASATVPVSVTIPTGSSTGQFTVTTSAVTSVVSGNIVAIYNYVTETTPLTVTNGPVVSLSSVSLNPASVQGGNTSTGTVTLSGAAPTGGIAVSLSSNSGSATVPASVTVAAGATTATFTVTTAVVTSSTTATISAAFNSVTKTANLTITPAPVALSSITLNPTSVQGGASSVGTVNLSGPAPTGGISVSLSSNATAATVPGSVTVTVGNTSATFTITTKTVTASTTATISGVYSGVTKTASLTITPPTVSLTSVSLNPASVVGGNSSTGTVTLTGAAPTGGVSVALSSNSSSATTPASVTVAAGATTATFTVTTKAVTSSTTATISAVYNSVTETASLTITSGTVSLTGLSLNPATVAGGNSSTGTVTLSSAAPAGGIAVSLSSNNSVATVPSSVTVSAGSTSATFTVTTKASVYTAMPAITASYGTTWVETLAIVGLSGVSTSPAVVNGGASATGTVTLTGAAPTGGAVVSLSSSNAAAVVPASVTVAAGSTTGTFSITTTAVSVSTDLTISATMGGLTETTGLTVNPESLTAFTLSPTSVVAGSSSTGTVTLSAAAPTGGVSVSLSSNNAVAVVPASVTVKPGATTATFTITTTSVSYTAKPAITASYGGNTIIETLTITP